MSFLPARLSDKVKHHAVQVRQSEMLDTAIALVKQHNPTRAIVFMPTKRDVRSLLRAAIGLPCSH